MKLRDPIYMSKNMSEYSKTWDFLPLSADSVPFKALSRLRTSTGKPLNLNKHKYYHHIKAINNEDLNQASSDCYLQYDIYQIEEDAHTHPHQEKLLDGININTSILRAQHKTSGSVASVQLVCFEGKMFVITLERVK